jgi:hypothetical protein
MKLVTGIVNNTRIDKSLRETNGMQVAVEGSRVQLTVSPWK